uniref:Uncharacterized protein n=1 Tax=Anguilla anguilla TaxID=7936 RepID=A0A0E9PDK0_ANGAN
MRNTQVRPQGFITDSVSTRHKNRD